MPHSTLFAVVVITADPLSHFAFGGPAGFSAVVFLEIGNLAFPEYRTRTATVSERIAEARRCSAVREIHSGFGSPLRISARLEGIIRAAQELTGRSARSIIGPLRQ